MEQVYVAKDLYDRMRSICAVQSVKEHAKVLDLIIRTQLDSMPRDTTTLIRALDSLEEEDFTAVYVSDHASHIVKQLARNSEVKASTVATYILQDSLPLLETLPGEIEGFLALQKETADKKSRQATMQVTVFISVFDAVATHLVENGPLPFAGAAAYIRALLVGLPSLEILRKVSSAPTEDGVSIADTMRGKKYKTIRVPIEVYYRIAQLHQITGVSRTRLVSYIVLDVLRATQRVVIDIDTTGMSPEDIFRETLRRYLLAGA